MTTTDGPAAGATWYLIEPHCGTIRAVPNVVRHTAHHAWAIDPPRGDDDEPYECRYTRAELFPTRAEAQLALLTRMRSILATLQDKYDAARCELAGFDAALADAERAAAAAHAG